MRNAIKIKKSDAKILLDATFPEYTGRTFSVVITESVTFHDTGWGSSTKNSYAFVNANLGYARLNVGAPWNNSLEDKTLELTPNIICAEHSIFCGKDLGITFYMHPANAPKWIAAQSN